MSLKPVQLPLDLPTRAAMGREVFLVSAANAPAVAMVDGWRAWPGGKLVLCGAPGTGKTHLAHVWSAQADAHIVAADAVETTHMDAPALVVEDVDRIAGDPAAEAAVLHVHNAVLARGGRLLLTGQGTGVRDWGLTLPDLSSRLAAAGLARLGPPDESLLAGVIVKLFADRHVRARPELVDWLVRRIERSFPAAEAAVARLDAAALENRRALGIRLAAEVLGAG